MSMKMESGPVKAKEGIQESRKEMKKAEKPSWTGERKILEHTAGEIWPAPSPTV